MICQRCNLPGAIDLDTGGQYHAELMECIALQGELIRKLEAKNARQRDAIENAPHAIGCYVAHCARGGYAVEEWQCNCWKSKALEDTDEQGTSKAGV